MVQASAEEAVVSILECGGFSITVTKPDNPVNFLDFYHEDDDLDSDFLMAPINEADYDSETQFCIDLQNPEGPRSFHDHYVTKRKKKKGKAGPDKAPEVASLLLALRAWRGVPGKAPEMFFAAMRTFPVRGRGGGGIAGAVNFVWETSRFKLAVKFPAREIGTCGEGPLHLQSPCTPQHFWECRRNLPHKIQGLPRNFPQRNLPPRILTWLEPPPPPLL